MTARITWFFRERSQLRKMGKLGVEDPDLQLLWTHEPRQRGMYQKAPAGCIVGRTAAAIIRGTRNDVVAKIYPGETGRWVVMERTDGYIVGCRTNTHKDLASAKAQALREYRYIVREKMITRFEEDGARKAREIATKTMAEELERRQP